MTQSAHAAGPLVSIVIPVYNGSNYVAQAIDSALAQTYKNCEIIVVNDGSDDSGATEQIVRAYGERVRYLAKENGGVGSALNLALREMKGTYFAWLSHDDLYAAEKIERQIGFLRDAGRDDLILYSNYYIFSDDGYHSSVQIHDTSPEGFRYRLARWSNVNGCTLLIPAQALRDIGGFDESLRTTQDYDLWFRLGQRFTFIHISATLVGSRYHPQQGVYTQMGRALSECHALHAKFARELDDSDVPVAARGLGGAYRELARSFWCRGFDEAARIAERRAADHGVGRSALLMTQGYGRAQFKLALFARRLLDPRVRVWLRQFATVKKNSVQTR